MGEIELGVQLTQVNKFNVTITKWKFIIEE